MLIRLDPRSDKPIYLQISDSLASHIETGAIGAGQRLPAARALGEDLEVNMHTVLKAYSSLEARGLVEMRRGRGGVIVSSALDVREAARTLVSQAKTKGLDRSETIRLVEEVWQ